MWILTRSAPMGKRGSLSSSSRRSPARKVRFDLPPFATPVEKLKQVEFVAAHPCRHRNFGLAQPDSAHAACGSALMQVACDTVVPAPGVQPLTVVPASPKRSIARGLPAKPLRTTRDSFLRGLTFELRRVRQRNARPALWKMRQPTGRAWHFDVGPRLERGVRLH